jgi:hypothetical protein
MKENYLNYSDDGCMNVFTRDQVYRMRTVLNNSPRRRSLLTNLLDTPSEALASHFTVYPNPAGQEAFIRCTMPILTARILDVVGKEMASISPEPAQSLAPVRLDLTAMKKGAYLILIETSSGTAVKRLLVAR